MKRFLKIFVPIFLSLTIVFGVIWYFFSYDTELTEGIFLSCADYFESKDNVDLANWFYDRAYEQSSDPDAIAVKLADRYSNKGQYTKAEVTLNKAILDGGGAKVYVALSNVYVKQDKLLDALNLLDNISDPALKSELDAMRPSAPTASYPEGKYNIYISVAFESTDHAIYVNANGQYPSTATDIYQSPITMAEGVNKLCALTVSKNGLVSTLSTLEYTIGGVIEKVNFHDNAIEKAVRSLLQVSDEYVIMTNDLWKIKSFTVPTEATDYSDLKHMTSLETLIIDSGAPDQMHAISENTSLKTLSISKTSLSDEDLEAIGKLLSLEQLTLDTCILSTISPLSGLTSLRQLNLNNNSLRDISALASMTELEELYMHQNALEDLSALSGCVKLKVLDISGNQNLQSISPLSGLTMLNELNISESKIADISALTGLTDLRQLRAQSNLITNIDALAQCLEMTYLDLSYNMISDLSPLSALTNITYLNFANNQVTQLPVWPVNCKLITINGSNNLISDLSPLSGLENINNILMSHNSEIEFIGMLTSCPVLIEIDVTKTKVSEEEAKKLQDPYSVIVHYDYIQASA